MSFLKKLLRRRTMKDKSGSEGGSPSRRDSDSSTSSPSGSPKLPRTTIRVRRKSSKHVADILPGLLLGSKEIAHDLHALKKHKVTHILNVTTEVENKFSDKFQYMRIDIPDMPCVRVVDYFDPAFEFIDEGREQGCVLVHCHYGASRSASFIIGYLMKTEHMRYKEALEYLQLLRREVDPNDGFEKQLKEYNPRGR